MLYNQTIDECLIIFVSKDIHGRYKFDTFNNNGEFKKLHDFLNVLVNKSNWLCEYLVLKM